MNITVHGNHIQVTEALKDYVYEKIGRLERFFDTPLNQEAKVTLSVEHDTHRVEVVMNLHGIIFRADEKSDDMYTSIDIVEDKLKRQLQKHKEKLNQQFHRRGKPIRVKNDLNHDVDAEISQSEIVRKKQFLMKPMAIEEAALQLELLDHDFFIFTNAETDQMNVLYRRRNGNLGLIEAK